MEDLIVSKFPEVIDVVAVKPLANFIVQATFSDASQREVDLEQYLVGPIFEPIRNNAKMFRRIFIDHGALAWPNGADIDTDTLYYNGEPPWAKSFHCAPIQSARTSHALASKSRRSHQRPSVTRRRVKVTSR